MGHSRLWVNFMGQDRTHNLYKKVHFEKDYLKNSFIFYAIRKVNL